MESVYLSNRFYTAISHKTSRLHVSRGFCCIHTQPLQHREQHVCFMTASALENAQLAVPTHQRNHMHERQRGGTQRGAACRAANSSSSADTSGGATSGKTCAKLAATRA